MRAFIILALVAAAAADVSHLFPKPGNQHYHAPSGGPDAEAVVVAQNVDVRPDGFDSNYETSNGIHGQEHGQLKDFGKDGAALVSSGSVSYTSPEGTPIELSYQADENGFQPQGAHLPTPPPTQAIPDYILRSLAYIEAHPQKEEPTQYRKF